MEKSDLTAGYHSEGDRTPVHEEKNIDATRYVPDITDPDAGKSDEERAAIVSNTHLSPFFSLCFPFWTTSPLSPLYTPTSPASIKRIITLTLIAPTRTKNSSVNSTSTSSPGSPSSTSSPSSTAPTSATPKSTASSPTYTCPKTNTKPPSPSSSSPTPSSNPSPTSSSKDSAPAFFYPSSCYCGEFVWCVWDSYTISRG